MSDLPSRQTLEADLQRYQESGDWTAQAETLLALAGLDAEERGETAIGLCGQAYDAYEKVHDQPGMAKALYALADLMLDLVDKRDDEQDIGYTEFTLFHVIRIYTQVLEMYIALHDFQHQAKVYRQLGYQINRTEESRAAYRNALACYVELGDKRGQAETLLELSDWYYGFEPETQYTLMEESAALYTELNDKKQAINIYHRLGNTAHAAKEYQRARAFFDIAQSLALEIDANDIMAQIMFDLGKTLLTLEGYQVYLQYHTASLNTIKQFRIECQSQIQQFLFSLPEIASSHNDFVTARQGYQAALAFAVKQNASGLQAQFYWSWGKMEYSMTTRYEMGLALCQWALTLFETYFPKVDYLHNNLHNELNQMRDAIKKRSNNS